MRKNNIALLSLTVITIINKKFNILSLNIRYVQKQGRINIFTDLRYIQASELSLEPEKDCLPTCITMVLEYLKDMVISYGLHFGGIIPHNYDANFWRDFWKHIFSQKAEHYIFGEKFQPFVYNDLPNLLKELNLRNEIDYRHTTLQENPIQKLEYIINKNIPPIAIVSPGLLYGDIDTSGEHAIVLIKKEGNVFYFYDPSKPTPVNYATASIDLFKIAHEARENAFMYLFPKRLYVSPSIKTEQATLIEGEFKWKK